MKKYSKSERKLLLGVRKHTALEKIFYQYFVGLFVLSLLPMILPFLWVLFSWKTGINRGVMLFLLLPLVTISLISFYLFFVKFNEIHTRKYIIPIKKLKNSVKFIFLSDIHLGREFFATTEHRFTKIINAINAQNPDAVFFGGDFIEKEIDIKLLSMFRLINSPIKLGVLGNHDSYALSDPTMEKPVSLINELKFFDIDVLYNENKIVEINNQKLMIGGISDLWSLDFDVENAFEKSEIPKVLLSHNPDITMFLEQKDDIDLVLSGHTHGAQIYINDKIRLPMPVRLTRLHKGIFDILPNTKLFVSTGVGHSGTRVRVNTENEICVIELIPYF